MPDLPTELDRLACITIQGGGVYGLSLLGQLRAVEQYGFKPVAFAGTSAGAIVASLASVGLKAETIREAFIERAEHGGLLDLVGPFTGRKGKPPFNVQDSERLTGRLKRYVAEVRRQVHARGIEPFWTRWAIWLSGLLQLPGAFKDLAPIEQLWDQSGVFSGRALCDFLDDLLRKAPALALLPGAEAVLRERTEARRQARPARGPADHDPPNPGWLTFGDLRAIQQWADPVEDPDEEKRRPAKTFPDPDTGERRSVYFPPLFLATTNLTTRTLELINSVEKKYEDWPVVEAVRASAGFPGFFRPVRRYTDRGEYAYVDGGVIANFPAFVFSGQFREWLCGDDPLTKKPRVKNAEAIVNRPWVHLGLRLTAREKTQGYAGEATDPKAFIQAMKELLVSQARTELERELVKYVPRAIQVGIHLDDTGGPDTVLNVRALTPHTVGVMFHKGREAADHDLAAYDFRLPRAEPPAGGRADEGVESLLREMITRAEAVFPADVRPGLLFRANVFVPRGPELVIRYRANMPRPAAQRAAGVTDRRQLNKDWNMRFDFQAGLSGLCFLRRETLVANLERIRTDRVGNPRPLFGFPAGTQRKVRGDRSWLMSVPIFDPEASGLRPLKTRVEFYSEQEYLLGYYAELDCVTDGAVFGVLNLDAGWAYPTDGVEPDLKRTVWVDPDPRKMVKQECIRIVADIMHGYAVRISKLFSEAFARKSPQPGT